MENKYDVVIIGAGPAGLSAGAHLAKAGKKIIILEKNSDIGDKVCAGGLTKKDFLELGLPQEIIEKEFKHINLRFGRRLIKLELKGPWIWTCSRQLLSKWQLEQAKIAGAEVIFDSAVKKINTDSVQLNNGSILYFKYLIGADGSGSIVRDFLNIKSKKIMLAMQYCVSDKKFDELEIFFDFQKFGPSYGWIFPHKNYVSVGAMCDPKFIAVKNLRTNFENWCKSLNIKTSTYQLQAAPINYNYQGSEFCNHLNMFLVGDASGIASGLTGEGIHPAITSGIEIAKKIIDPSYDLKGIKKLLCDKKLEEKLLKIYKINKIIFELTANLGAILLKNKMFRQKTIRFLTER